MSLNYKNLLIALAAGGGVLLAATLYDKFFRSRSHKLDAKKLSEDLKALGPLWLTKDGTIEKHQMAFILGLSKRYLPAYAGSEREKFARYRQALLSTNNESKYNEALIESVNFEHKCLNEIAVEICKSLNISEDTFYESLEYYETHKDAEFITIMQRVAKGEPKEEVTTTISALQAAQLKDEIVSLMKEIRDEPAMRLTAELKMKLKDSDTVATQQKMVEMKAFDLMFQIHGLRRNEIELAFEKYGLTKDFITLSQSV